VRKQTKWQALALVALGAVLGYAAASGKLLAPWKADAAPTITDPAGGKPSPPACCAEGVNRGELLALGAHHDAVAARAEKSGKKPNILVIWGDDIGWFNPSCYHRGMMGYRTPNIDRIAREGGTGSRA